MLQCLMLIFVKNRNRYFKKISDLLFLLNLTFKSKIKLNVPKPDQYKVNVISNNHDTFNTAFFHSENFKKPELLIKELIEILLETEIFF